jgi:long-chain alkane monooxygenase
MPMSQVEPRPFILNAFEMTTVSHTNFGLWRHPEDRTSEYTGLRFWTDLARVLDEGGFDGLFIADGVGQLDVYGGSAAAALAGGVQAPINDPLLAVSAMAAVTEHLGFGLTVSTTYEYPYLLARKFTTLDHYTQGRVAWNVVTSTRDSAARNILGLDSQIPHDTRYEIAEEFIDVAYKLWEGSWEDDAVVRDRERRVYTDPAKVHPIDHRGKHFTVPGPHLSEPSPQRTPVLFQAGTSEAGKKFAARHAEVVFLHGPTPELVRRQTDDIRARAVAAGRGRDAVKFITSVLIVTGPTDAAAQARYEELSGYHSAEGSLVLLSGVTGEDWSTSDLDAPMEYIETEGGRSAINTYTRLDPTQRWTLRDIYGNLGRGEAIVGGPETVADRLEALAEAGGLDGFNLSYALMPGTFEDFIEYVVPELRRRGRIRERQPGQTLRQRLFGAESPYVPEEHPGARYRHEGPTWPSIEPSRAPETAAA